MKKKSALFAILIVIVIAGMAIGWSSLFGHAQSLVTPSSVPPRFELVRIAPSYENGKFSFAAIALLPDDVILGTGYDGVDPRRLRISQNLGKTWETKYFTKKFTIPSSISFFDPARGWIGTDTGIFRTLDGGRDWIESSINGHLSTTQLAILDAQHVIFTGKHNIAGEVSAQIWITNDGGRTWKKSYENRKFTTPFSIVATSRSTALMILDERHLIRTEDGGLSWETVPSFEFRTNCLVADKRGQVWAVGPAGTFIVSADGGATWQKPKAFPSQFQSTVWYSATFIDEMRGYAVGSRGSFVSTDDGGETWHPMNDAETLSEDLYQVLATKSLGIIRGADYLYRFDPMRRGDDE